MNDEVRNLPVYPRLDEICSRLLEESSLILQASAGAGKTSLLNCITGFYRAQQGKIVFNGKEITRLHTHELVGVGIGAFTYLVALLLLGGLGLSQALLRIVAGGSTRPMVSLGGLGFRNMARRSGRSLAIVGLLACGVFMVVAVGANRHDPMAQPQSRGSGTGGFAFYGETSVPILHDLNTKEGRDALGLGRDDLEGVEVVQLRVHEGDDASCLNLNRAQQPRLLGVRSQELSRREAFKFSQIIDAGQQEEGWDLLRMDLEAGSVPALGDYPTVFWGLGKNIGDELEYSDERGRVLRVRIVGMLASSVLQGSLVIAENEFMARFPSESGYRAFLIDAPSEKVAAVEQTLISGLRDFGLVLTPTVERLVSKV